MAYSAEISRTNPSYFLFMIDQSTSMEDNIAGSDSKSKAQALADAINRLLQELVIKCSKSEGVRDYYHVSILGYGSNIGSAFLGDLEGEEKVSIGELANNPARIEERTKKVDDGAGGLVDQTVKFPIWFDAYANGGTPMCQAAGMAKNLLTNWLEENPDCFPPVVIHMTDGEATDGDPHDSLKEITELSSSDGNVLLFNIHLSDNPDARKIEFPDSENDLPDDYAKMLFSTASPLTKFMIQVASTEYGYGLSDGAKGFVMNADLPIIIKTLDIGTRASNLR